MRSIALATAIVFSPVAAHAITVTTVDDGEHIHREEWSPIPTSIFETNNVALFALRDETISFQVVLSGIADESAAVISVKPFTGGAGADHVRVDPFVERFIEVTHASGNLHEAGSLAFTAEAAPPHAASIGWIADPLVPGAKAVLKKAERAAFWIDIHIPASMEVGTLRSELTIAVDGQIKATRAITIEVGEASIHRTFIPFAFLDREALDKRTGATGAAAIRNEVQATKLLHAHGLDVTDPVPEEKDGSYFADENGESAFLREGSRTRVVGVYGTLGEPGPSKLDRISRTLDAWRVFPEESGMPFLYAVDEDCASPRVAGWKTVLASDPRTKSLRVGLTCSKPPIDQSADVVMMTTEAYSPEQRTRTGQAVWTYNGRRPHAGAMMLDVPATDLRANGWIAAKYGIARWFYWNANFWFDDNKGGNGGKDGFDPFVVSETFHNRDGDYAMGDGILLYPGHQPAPMHDEQIEGVIPSVRLKNLRRGVMDATYIEQARAKDRAATEAIVNAMIPVALEGAWGPTSWPAGGADWTTARRALFDLLAGKSAVFSRSEKAPTRGALDRFTYTYLRRNHTKHLWFLVVPALIYLLWKGRKRLSE